MTRKKRSRGLDLEAAPDDEALQDGGVLGEHGDQLYREGGLEVLYR